jgi:hypothetical protein
MTSEDELLEAIRLRAHSHRPDGIFIPVTIEEIDDAEHALGFPLPNILRRIYMEIGNELDLAMGHLIEIVPNPDIDEYYCLQQEYTDIKEAFYQYKFYINGQIQNGWPEKLLPLFDIGCNVQLCVDCGKEKYPIYFFDFATLNPDNLVFPSVISHVNDSLTDFLWNFDQEMYRRYSKTHLNDCEYIASRYEWTPKTPHIDNMTVNEGLWEGDDDLADPFAE